MSLTERERQSLERVLNQCDAALADKPTLASVYDAHWRAEFRKQRLNSESMADVSYPSAYAVHILEVTLPADYQMRIEEGARILFSKLADADTSHLIERMRWTDCLSAEEELLLARAFALEFGENAILPPPGNRSERRPEFILHANRLEIDVEAKGLRQTERVQELNQSAIRSGTGGWFTFEKVDDPARLRAAVARKLLVARENVPRIVILTQYTPWLTPDVAIPLLRQLSLSPQEFQIPEDKHPLTIGYVCHRRIQGVWFNKRVVTSRNVGIELQERIRTAIRNCFYPRSDEVFFDETVSADQEQRLIREIMS